MDIDNLLHQQMLDRESAVVASLEAKLGLHQNWKRYELRNGKFGAYFYDNFSEKDLGLEDVLHILNQGESQ